MEPRLWEDDRRVYRRRYSSGGVGPICGSLLTWGLVGIVATLVGVGLGAECTLKEPITQRNITGVIAAGDALQVEEIYQKIPWYAKSPEIVGNPGRESFDISFGSARWLMYGRIIPAPGAPNADFNPYYEHK